MMAIPNALILETVGSEADRIAFAEVVDRPPVVEDGWLRLDDRPGLGAALLDDAPACRAAIPIEGTR
jgi:L-alanine-DL-glutamate epimerase-like enolase superfamily enzyme